MYATVRRYEGITDTKEAGRRVKEEFLPIISRIPGFIAYYWVDAGDGVMISTGVYRDKAAADESNRKAQEWIQQAAVSLYPNPPKITSGEVVVHNAK